MTEKDKTIDGMSVRRASSQRRSGGIDGLRPASGAKTTVSREVRMRQAEKVLREREARERTVREARLRTARIEAAQIRTARDTSVRPVKVMQGNVYSQPATRRVAMETRRPIERAVVTRPMTTRMAAARAVTERGAAVKAAARPIARTAPKPVARVATESSTMRPSSTRVMATPTAKRLGADFAVAKKTAAVSQKTTRAIPKETSV